MTKVKGHYGFLTWPERMDVNCTCWVGYISKSVVSRSDWYINSTISQGQIFNVEIPQSLRYVTLVQSSGVLSINHLLCARLSLNEGNSLVTFTDWSMIVCWTGKHNQPNWAHTHTCTCLLLSIQSHDGFICTDISYSQTMIWLQLISQFK